jgi:hypothetical protein
LPTSASRRTSIAFALLMGGATHPHEVFLGERTGNTLNLRPLTALNQPLLDEVHIVAPEEFEVQADDGVADSRLAA